MPVKSRVLLKLSGEVLVGKGKAGLDPETLGRVAKEIQQVQAQGHQICVVVGGGNLCRGKDRAAQGLSRNTADGIGMLATVMNALALQDFLEQIGVPARVLTAFSVSALAEVYIRRRAIRHLEKGRVVIFGAGTGSPFFSTDTAAALRASEMECSLLLKGTKVDGVYDKDPEVYPNAKRKKHMSYKEVLDHSLEVLDQTAVTLAKENGIPILVFSIRTPGAFPKVVQGNGVFTRIDEG